MIKEIAKKYFKDIIYIVLFLIIISFEIIILLINNQNESVSLEEESIPPIDVSKTEESRKVKFEIKGEVNAPGVYELDENSRVIDAIHIAGELKENANINYINLSKIIEDEMVIIIYSNDDILNYQKGNQKIEYIYLEKECVCPDSINEACVKEENVYATEQNSNQEEKETNKNTKININTASIDELLTLSGIGESKAKKIIEYREKSLFKNIEELNEVNGIGTSIFEKIKDSITV